MTGDHADEGRLAGAVGADDAPHLARHQREFDLPAATRPRNRFVSPSSLSSSTCRFLSCRRRTSSRRAPPGRPGREHDGDEQQALDERPVLRDHRTQIVRERRDDDRTEEGAQEARRPPIATQMTTCVEKDTRKRRMGEAGVGRIERASQARAGPTGRRPASYRGGRRSRAPACGLRSRECRR